MGAIKYFGSGMGSMLKVPQISFFGNIPGSRKYAGGGLAANGNIYCAPRQATRVLEINPADKTATLIGDTISGSNDKYVGAVPHPNGKIYCIPRNIHAVLEIDPIAKTTTMKGTVWQIAGQWFGGLLHPNGKIYGIPSSRNSFLEFDPVIGEGVLVGNVSGRYLGAVLGVNEKIYCIPQDGNGAILEFDPVTLSANYFSTIPNGAFGAILDSTGDISLVTQGRHYMQVNYNTKSVEKSKPLEASEPSTGLSQGPNGLIYRITETNNSTVIDPQSGKHRNFNIEGVGGFYGSVMAANGCIYGIPWNSTQVVELSGIGLPTPDMYTMPPLTDLAASTYNRYQNKF